MSGQFDKFERRAFKFNGTKPEATSFITIKLNLDFTFTGDIFQNGTFDDMQKSEVTFYFYVWPKLDYLPEGSFKPILSQTKINRINFYESVFNIPVQTKIDCEHCRNYWSIRNGFKEQIYDAVCYSNKNHQDQADKYLFDHDIVTKFESKYAQFNSI